MKCAIRTAASTSLNHDSLNSHDPSDPVGKPTSVPLNSEYVCFGPESGRDTIVWKRGLYVNGYCPRHPLLIVGNGLPGASRTTAPIKCVSAVVPFCARTIVSVPLESAVT